jgi:FlaG/FlaF family flagellin (archaellin)
MMSDRALSPVVGMVILVLLTAFLAYSVWIFVDEFADSRTTGDNANIDIYSENVTVTPGTDHYSPYQLTVSGEYENADHLTVGGEAYQIRNQTVNRVSIEPGRYQLTIYDGEEQLGTETVVVYDE